MNNGISQAFFKSIIHPISYIKDHSLMSWFAAVILLPVPAILQQIINLYWRIIDDGSE